MTNGLNTTKKKEAAEKMSTSPIPLIPRKTQEIPISKLTLLESNPRKTKKEAEQHKPITCGMKFKVKKHGSS